MYIRMKMKVNLDTSIENLLYLEYMQKNQQIQDTKSNEDEKHSWWLQGAPKDKNEN